MKKLFLMTVLMGLGVAFADGLETYDDLYEVEKTQPTFWDVTSHTETKIYTKTAKITCMTDAFSSFDTPFAFSPFDSRIFSSIYGVLPAFSTLPSGLMFIAR